MERLLVFVVAVLTSVLVASPAQAAGKPVVTTGTATSITEIGATLNGTVNPKGRSTTARFEYGLTISYGSSTTDQAMGSGNVAVPASAIISGLTSGTIYHFRIRATNSAGTNLGADKTFTTNSPPPPPPPPGGAYWSDKYKAWLNGPNPTGDPNFYPVGVWLQNPDRVRNGQQNALNYKNAGVTHDVGISSWPGCAWCVGEEDALIGNQWPAWLDAANGAGKARLDARPELGPWLRAWFLSDEADMAHWDPNNTFAYPTNYRDYGNAMRALDPTRPTYSNFGKGMAMSNPGWNGYQYWQPGGGGTYEADMALYCQSSDIVSADYYGWTDPWEPADYHGAWTYGRVIDSIRLYCGPDKLALGVVETGQPWDITPDAITPDELEAAVWNIVAHGGNGWVYFAHNFYGGMVEDGMLADPVMTARVTQVDATVSALAPVLNTQSQIGVTVSSTNSIPVAFQYKLSGGLHYIVAQADGDSTHNNSGATTATFTIAGMTDGVANVVGEGRTVPIVGGSLVDNFAAYGHHVYQF